jgi:hypothetical protein
VLPRRPPETDAVRTLLFADADPQRLEQMMSIARETRLLVEGARSPDAALTAMARGGVDVLLIAENFDNGRPLELARRASAPVCILVARAARLDARLPPGVDRVVTWPFTAETLRRVVDGA